MERTLSYLIRDRAKIEEMYQYRNILPQVDFNKDVSLFRYHALKVLLYYFSTDNTYILDDGDISISKGTRVGLVDFTPLGDVHGFPENRTHALYKGVDTLKKFSRFLDNIPEESSEEIPQYLIGYTNRDLVRLVTRRLGFRSNLGTAPADTHFITVVGETANIMTRFANATAEHFPTKEVFNGFRARAKRERTRG